MSETPYRWVPPGLNEEEVEEFLSLKPSIPSASRSAISRWFTHDLGGMYSFSLDFFREFQVASGIDLAIGSEDRIAVYAVRDLIENLDETTLVYMIDFKLSGNSVTSTNYKSSVVSRLEKILHNSGSNWDVGERQGRYGLVERVPSGVAAVMEQVLNEQNKASDLLKRAWERAYGFSPEPSGAYQDAVKAVEIMANPLLSPNDRDATLGKDINVLRTQLEHWSFVMAGSKHKPAPEHVLSTMQLLWHSQTDRHGKTDYADVSEGEAKAAVLLAATLVGWFSQGALKKRDP